MVTELQRDPNGCPPRWQCSMLRCACFLYLTRQPRQAKDKGRSVLAMTFSSMPVGPLGVTCCQVHHKPCGWRAFVAGHDHVPFAHEGKCRGRKAKMLSIGAPWRSYILHMVLGGFPLLKSRQRCRLRLASVSLAALVEQNVVP